MQVELESLVTCPECGHQEQELMEPDACIVVYDCDGCGSTLRPREGDCCVFCSFGSVPCPPIQVEEETGWYEDPAGEWQA